MKVIIWGCNPSRQFGKSGSLKTLNIWLETIDLNCNCTSFCNIYDGFGQFSLRDVKRDYIREISKDYDKILALGTKASDVLNLMGIDHFRLPHPSGLNRKLNNKRYVEHTLSECREYLWD